MTKDNDFEIGFLIAASSDDGVVYGRTRAIRALSYVTNHRWDVIVRQMLDEGLIESRGIRRPMKLTAKGLAERERIEDGPRVATVCKAGDLLYKRTVGKTPNDEQPS